jgi:endonuclease/exonuclease/phosphatase family metal-dependent hydrolase
MMAESRPRIKVPVPATTDRPMIPIHRIAMPALFLSIGLLFLAATPAIAEDSLSVSVLTFNIRYGTANDGENSWPRRKELVFDVIRERNADFVGLQEALRFQIDAIREAVPGYGEVGVGRDDGKEAGEYSAILYRQDHWEVDTGGTFWLSDAPNVPGSTGWGNNITRVVTFARFVETSSGRAVWLFNTHFDHQSQSSREKSAELLARRIADRDPADPVIVTGDFNAGEDNPAVQYLTGNGTGSPVRLVDTFRAVHPDADNVGTFNGFAATSDGPKIDYILVEPGTRVLQADIIRDHDDGRYPSDHFPVSAEIQFPAAVGGQ